MAAFTRRAVRAVWRVSREPSSLSAPAAHTSATLLRVRSAKGTFGRDFIILRKTNYKILEDTARCAGLLLAPAKGFGLWLNLFLPFGEKKLLMLFWPIFDNFGV